MRARTAKILSKLGFCVFGISLLFFLPKFFISWTIKNADLSVFELFFIIFIFINLFAILLDVLVMGFVIEAGVIANHFGAFLVQKKWTKWAFCLIRSDYYILRLRYYQSNVYRLLGLPRIGVYYSEGDTWRGLDRPSFSRMIFRAFRFVLSAPFLVTMAYIAFLHGVLDLGSFASVLPTFSDIRGYIAETTSKYGLFGVIAPLFVPAVSLISVFLFFYFYGTKREVRLLVNEGNGKDFKEVVLLYEKLLGWIDRHIVEIADNFDYVIGIQSSIVQGQLENKIENYIELKGYTKKLAICEWPFLELSDYEVNDFVETIKRLSEEQLRPHARYLASVKYDMWQLWLTFPKMSVKRVNSLFFTKTGVNERCIRNFSFPYRVEKGQVEEEEKDCAFVLAFSIYDSLEELYKIKRASDELRRYFYSSRMEESLLKAFDKKTNSS